MSIKRTDESNKTCELTNLEECQLITTPENKVSPITFKNLKNQGSDYDHYHNVYQHKSETSSKADIDKILTTMTKMDNTTCGLWIFKGAFMQRFANKKAYVILYGIGGTVLAMTFSYFEATITTIEKRFKIPSRNTGIITIGKDISDLFASAVLSYYAGNGHRPRWIGFGIFTLFIFAVMNVLPYFIYGPGDDALTLTVQHGGVYDSNATLEILTKEKAKILCKLNSTGIGATCEPEEGSLIPQIILFIGQFISGIGSSLYNIFGVAYMDDNVKKSKSPALLSISYFIRMLGPAFGYSISSFCLRLYVAPNLTPVITNDDPRWLGAWWMGWILIALTLLVSAITLSMFPKELPRAAARKFLQNKVSENLLNEHNKSDTTEQKPSFVDMLVTFKTFLKNPTLMCNNFASIFYFFGYLPYWVFTAKYIEVQYRQSAATSNLVTGTVALAFSAIGVLLAGLAIPKYKPKARYLALWNVIVGFLTAGGMLTYAFLGCLENENSTIVNIPDINHDFASTSSCNALCQCDFVKYTPICGEDGNTYISPCHAGCREQIISPPNSEKIFRDCSCIPKFNASKIHDNFFAAMEVSPPVNTLDMVPKQNGSAVPGTCPVNCFKPFVTFLAVMCFLKFIGATGRASNFLVSIRCVPEKDKTVSMGFGAMMLSLLAFIPSPIFFGWILDSFCLVWGKTCTTKGNCWLYDAKAMRYGLNTITSSFVLMGTLFDIGVWYFVKDLQIFDAEIDDVRQAESRRSEKQFETETVL